MARLIQGPATTARGSLADLDRMLTRLRKTLLHADAEHERRLRAIEYERVKAGRNLDYARNLLTQLELDALAIKIQTRRQEVQLDLNRKRDVYEQLVERLHELEEMSVDSDEDIEDEEDLVEKYLLCTHASQEGEGSEGEGGQEKERDKSRTEKERDMEKEAIRASETLQDAPPEAPKGIQNGHNPDLTVPTNTLRSRGPAKSTTTPAPAANTASTTSSQPPNAQPPSDNRTQLFGNRSQDKHTTDLTSTATTEAIATVQRMEHESLTNDMVNISRRLKESARAFHASLEEEKDVLSAATTALERNETGLDAAAGRMGTLRRFTEGKGWLGRMKLYILVYGLWAVALFLVFAMPKLRF